MVKIPNPQEMLDAGVHFGHQSKHWHPRMEKYIFKKHSGIHVVDLYKTEEKLKTAVDFVTKVASTGKRIIFVGTKPQSKETIEIEAKRSGALFVTERWLGGTLTNFKALKENRDKLVTMKTKMEKGDYKDLTKKERLMISREIEKSEINYGGLVGLSEQPGLVFVVDARREKTAVLECKSMNVPVVSLVDTNTDPSLIDYVIPGNDDAIKSVALITRVIADAVIEGYKHFDKHGAPEENEESTTESTDTKQVESPKKTSAKKVESKKDKAVVRSSKKAETKDEVVKKTPKKAATKKAVSKVAKPTSKKTTKKK